MLPTILHVDTTIGVEILGVDNSLNLKGFIIHHAFGGGTGSGLGALILERIAVDYEMKLKIRFEVYASQKMSTCILDRLLPSSVRKSRRMRRILYWR